MIARLTHVAILDDDPSIRTALSRLLKASGMIARAYATGEELFESLALNCPDCLLLDLQMPKMSGLDVLNCLRQRQIRIPTIVITAHSEAGSRSACLNAGAVAYLHKPLDADQLVQTIETVIQTSETVCETPLRETLPRFS
jgi:FixJ family two-component response regulator